MALGSDSVRIKITATDATKKAFSSVKRGLGQVGKAAADVTKKVAKFGIAAATVAAGALVALTKRSLVSADALAKTADKLGVTTEALAGLQYAGELTGVGVNKMNMALQRMGRRVAEAAVGTGEAVKALAELGLNAKQLNKLPLDQQMQRVADAMQDVESPTVRLRLAMKLFDSEGVALVNTLAKGSQGLKDMQAEAEHLGLTISRVDAAQIEKVNDDITRAKSVFTGLGNQLATAFAPILQGISTDFYQAALDSAEFGTIGQRAANAVVRAFGFVADAVQGMRVGWLGLKMLTAEYFAFVIRNGAELIDVVTAIPKAIVDAYNKAADFFGLDKIDFDPGGTLRDFGDSFSNVAKDFKADFDAELAKPLPSEAIDTWFEDVQAKARQAAEEVASAVAVPSGDGVGGGIFQMPTMGDSLYSEYDEAIKRSNEFTDVLAATFESFGMGLSETQLSIASAYATAASLTMQQMSVLANALGKGSGAAKAFYVVNQAMAAGMAIVNGMVAGTAIRLAYAQLAAMTANPALAAAGEAHAKFAEVMGYVSAAAIMGQTIGSFEGGGFTGSGARTGGVDGKGGFHAILHPNETVIDHTKNYNSDSDIQIDRTTSAMNKKTVNNNNNSNVINASNRFFSESVQPRPLKSFEGGGETGSGSRTGGVDGKGGFNAILHPNETIIDNTRNQAQPRAAVVNINVTAADTKDFDRLLTDRRGMLASLINKELNRQGRAL